jgi:hypothetical protein
MRKSCHPPLPSTKHQAPSTGSEATLTVELLGVARLLARRRCVSLHLAPDATLREVGSALAGVHPELVGPVLRDDGGLAPGVVYSRDGRALTTDVEEPARHAEDAGMLLLIPTLEGG